VGREGWLHYRPDVEYLTGPVPGPGAPAPARKRAVEGEQTGAAVQPDPVKASYGSTSSFPHAASG
jgi:hypothetical protein